ncbi:hypothetical protein V6C27_09060 [Peptococcaceae bacterium 1198_IL3148]
MAKVLKEGVTYNQKDVIDVLSEFSNFKDRVDKRYKDVSHELRGKPNEHELWVSIYLIASEYAEESHNKRQKQDVVQKIS